LSRFTLHNACATVRVTTVIILTTMCVAYTKRLDECDLLVVTDVECEENGSDVEDQVSEKRPLHDMKRTTQTHCTNDNCCQKYSRTW